MVDILALLDALNWCKIIDSYHKDVIVLILQPVVCSLYKHLNATPETTSFEYYFIDIF